MDTTWWLLFAVAVAWHVREGLRHWRTASRRIDEDIIVFNREEAAMAPRVRR